MKEKLAEFHTMILIYMSQAGVYGYTLAHTLATVFGTNGWLAVLIVAALALVNTGLIAAVYKLGKGKSIFEVMEQSVPAFLLFPVYLPLALFWAVIGGLFMKEYILIMQLISFPSTNPMLFLFSLALLALYLMNKGIYNISKVATVFFILSFWVTFIFFFYHAEFQWSRLTPFVFQEGEPHYFIQGILEAYPAFLGYEVSLLLFPYTDKKTHLIRATFTGVILISVVYLYYNLFSFGFFSLGQLKMLEFPLLDLFGYVKLPLLERFENFLYGLLLFSTLITYALYGWSSVEVAKRMFGKVKTGVLNVIIIAIGYIVCFYPKVLGDIQHWIKYASFIEIAISFSLPILLIFLLLIQRLKGRATG